MGHKPATGTHVWRAYARAYAAHNSAHNFAARATFGGSADEGQESVVASAKTPCTIWAELCRPYPSPERGMQLCAPVVNLSLIHI